MNITMPTVLVTAPSVTGPNDPALAAISPIEHVSAVQGRVLLIHGKDDTVVPYDQSDVMVSALKRAIS